MCGMCDEVEGRRRCQVVTLWRRGGGPVAVRVDFDCGFARPHASMGPPGPGWGMTLCTTAESQAYASSRKDNRTVVRDTSRNAVVCSFWIEARCVGLSRWVRFRLCCNVPVEGRPLVESTAFRCEEHCQGATLPTYRYPTDIKVTFACKPRKYKLPRRVWGWNCALAQPRWLFWWRFFMISLALDGLPTQRCPQRGG